MSTWFSGLRCWMAHSKLGRIIGRYCAKKALLTNEFNSVLGDDLNMTYTIPPNCSLPNVTWITFRRTRKFYRSITAWFALNQVNSWNKLNVIIYWGGKLTDWHQASGFLKFHSKVRFRQWNAVIEVIRKYTDTWFSMLMSTGCQAYKIFDSWVVVMIVDLKSPE